MVNEIQYTSISRVLDNLLEHPMLQGLTVEQAVRYTVRFIALHGFSKFYQDKIEEIPIADYRGMLPCDLVSIIQVRDASTGICLRSMTDTFTPGLKPKTIDFQEFDWRRRRNMKPAVSNTSFEEEQPSTAVAIEPSFKTQGNVIYTSFPEGVVEIAYKSIPVDEEGYPMIIDDENYLACLEAYIKLQRFTVLYDLNKISVGVLQNAQQDYAFRAGSLRSAFTTPSYSEAQTLTNIYNTLIFNQRAFDQSFGSLGNREYMRNH